MKGRQTNKKHDSHSSKPISFKAVQSKSPDRLYYVKDKYHQLNHFFTRTMNSLYDTFTSMLPADSKQLHDFSNIIKPAIASGVALLVGEYMTSRLSRTYSESDEYDFMYKFVLGSAILGYSALNRVTEHRIQSDTGKSVAIAAEVLAIASLYSSSFRASRYFFDRVLSDSYSLIASLGVSTLVIPGGFSYFTQKFHERSLKKLYGKGAQRSDTALIPAGLTPIGNAYFQGNHYLVSELVPVSRLFQLGLISDNILNNKKLVKRFRNFPALVADVGPQIVKRLTTQLANVEEDYKYNTTTQNVLRINSKGSLWEKVERDKLRNGDLVYCDNELSMSSVPVSGEIVALKRDEKGEFTQQLEVKKCSVNLQRHNGEDLWIEFKTDTAAASEFSQMDLHAIHDGKQVGVLTGAKLNLYGGNNFFIRIKDEKEKLVGNHYEKKATINDIITEHKRKNVMYSMVSSLAMGALLANDFSNIPTRSLNLLFNLFQMMIPFSETFLRDRVNSHFMAAINQDLGEYKMDAMDALRIVDLNNALSGYYNDKFPQGVAIVSDKTGTLTTSKMNVLGVWTPDMPSKVMDLLKDEKSILLPGRKKQDACFEVFASAYTNNKKELEPEEFAILQVFQDLFKNNELLQIHILGNQHFKKTFLTDGVEKTIETHHLGLHRKLGGRLTLVEDGEHRYLVFCGVPRADRFYGSSLLSAYQQMQVRTQVLSRDWCVARNEISREHFDAIKDLFFEDKKEELEAYLLSFPVLIQGFAHFGTFIVDNPVKKSAEKFIPQCKSMGIPVFVATGDTAKSAENIAKVLCSEDTQQIITIKASDVKLNLEREFVPHSTVIFAGINADILVLFERIMRVDIKSRPSIIFCEMSTEGKGVLARYLKNKGYFVVANGDGTNDVAMMKSADLVIAHLTEDGSYAPGVSHLANLNDKQLQILRHSDESFYELFDIHLPRSEFLNLFMPLANSQEKPSMALLLKSSKMSFELAKAFGMTGVKEMWQQHWFSVLFDLMWLGISYREIIASADLPADNKHLGVSDFSTRCMLTTVALAALQSMITYATTGESTNGIWMLAMLSFLPLVLKSIFSTYAEVQKEAYPQSERCKIEVLDEKDNGSVSGCKASLFCNKEMASKGKVVASAPVVVKEAAQQSNVMALC
jgi:Ca2+-transporting ATPase